MSHTAPKINVLHLTFDMGIGGTEQVIKNLIESTGDLPIKHHICCLEGPIGPWGKDLEQQGIAVYCVPRSAKITWHVVKQVREMITSNDIDIVQGHQYTPFVFGFLASRFTKAKIIFTEHGRFFPDIVSAKRRFINKLIFPFVTAVTSISQATKQALVEHEGIPKTAIDVIYNGIQPVLPSQDSAISALKEKHELPQDAIVFGTIARLDPIKNQGMMIRAFADVQKTNPTARLIIVGDGPERKALETLVDELAVTDAVIFTGFIAQPADYINLLDVFLLTSLSEGTSMTLLEAMSAGKPSIVTNVGGNPELINHPVLGSVVELSTEEISNAMQMWLKTLNERTHQPDAIKQQFRDRFSSTTMVEHFYALYRNSLNHEGSDAP